MERAARVASLLKQRRETVAIAESSTGGLVAAALVAQPGASAYFRGGAVVYTREAREALLGMTDADMEGLRSATEPYAALIARRIRMAHQATWGVGESGASGPSGNRYGDKPGHCCLAISGPTGQTATLETGSADRVMNMRVFAASVFDAFEAALRASAGGSA